MNNKKQDDTFVCGLCDSESSGTPGTCCGAKREGKKKAGAWVAGTCPCDKHKEHRHT